jgi:hypothetical protein
MQCGHPISLHLLHAWTGLLEKRLYAHPILPFGGIDQIGFSCGMRMERKAYKDHSKNGGSQSADRQVTTEKGRHHEVEKGVEVTALERNWIEQRFHFAVAVCEGF